MKTHLLLLAIVVTALTACNKEIIRGSGNEITEERSVNNFTRVRAEGSTMVFITQGTAFKVQVKGYENLLPYFETTVNNGTLQLGFMNNLAISNNNIQVIITMPVVESLSLSGSGVIMVSGIFPTTANMDIRILGSGDISFENGSAANLTTNISGSGDIKAFGFVTLKANTTTSGSGDTEISVTTELNAKIDGSGNVYYKGTPVVTSQIAGSGVVAKK